VWFDSHCHLYDLGDEAAIAGAVERARAASVSEMLIPGVDAASSSRAIEIAVQHRAWAAVGIHPSETSGWEESQMQAIADLLEHPQAVAIGETGLDFYRDHAPQELQRENFAAHIALAKKHSKALIIHTRESADAALAMLEQQGAPQGVVFHCWSGTQSELQRALSLGAFISFAGNVSFKSAESLRDAARAVPADRLLVETDSPYLTPVPHRGTANEPAYVRDVGTAVANARSQPVGEIAIMTSSNARRVFALTER
jgi:TatD DNase family protein